MKNRKILDKLILNIGDLFVDPLKVQSGLLIKILKKHIILSWGDESTKISKWEITNRVNIKKSILHFPVKKNNIKKK